MLEGGAGLASLPGEPQLVLEEDAGRPMLELDRGLPEATLSLSLPGLCTGDGAASRLCGSVSVIAGMLSPMLADDGGFY